MIPKNWSMPGDINVTATCTTCSIWGFYPGVTLETLLTLIDENMCVGNVSTVAQFSWNWQRVM